MDKLLESLFPEGKRITAERKTFPQIKGATTFSLTTFSIMTLGLTATLRITSLSIEYRYVECHFSCVVFL